MRGSFEDLQDLFAFFIRRRCLLRGLKEGLFHQTGDALAVLIAGSGYISFIHYKTMLHIYH